MVIERIRSALASNECITITPVYVLEESVTSCRPLTRDAPLHTKRVYLKSGADRQKEELTVRLTLQLLLCGAFENGQVLNQKYRRQR